ncbi:probable CoA ligase CCL11 isoform X2 [Vigna umbellata]|uniref:probable CoA ligase CCL11 isoform X1 n=1 Tax=Vigna umbellata TaxID=87088 RepID=UPI001F5E3F83|nr:probable CoA ligase CCL11 isoform X1 [Vigna umbellata]XP_047168658.1 probable CoA ligase CCL11 isoform X2 [Vigna umbellata]
MDKLTPNAANSVPLTPLTFLERAAIVYGDSHSIVYDHISFTWSQTHRRCLQLASSLTSLGLGRGQVISVLSPNTPSMYELQFAVPMSGAILNNLNLRLDPHALSVLLRHSESKLVFVHSQSLPLILTTLSKFPHTTPRPSLVLITDDDYGDADAVAAAHAIDTYERLLSRGNQNFRWARPNSEWDPITLNYTSGTTASPKGVIHSHRATFMIALDSLIDWCVPKQPIYLWTLPMFHANGWGFAWGIAAVGGTNVCIRKTNAPIIYRSIESHNVTHMCAAPVVLNMLLTRAEPLKNPVHVLIGGSTPPASVLARAEEVGFVVSHGYGMTETLGVVVSCAWKREWDTLPGRERARLLARQGVRTAAVSEVDVVDPASGVSVKRDGVTSGEVVVRGSCVMMGYLKDLEGTRRCVRENGWLYTGDVGVVHGDGYLEIKDRSKDVIISGGENVSSVEVEAVMYAHPAVREAAVVGRPDEFWGETPCAFVELKERLERRPKEEELVEFCRERLAHFMVPKTVVFKDALPKTPTGKILKHVLRKEAQGMGSLATRSRM